MELLKLEGKMTTAKKSFILYIDQRDTFEALSPEHCKELVLAIFDQSSGLKPTLSDYTKVIFIPFKHQLARDGDSWERTRKERVKAGRKGGEQKAKNLAKLANAKLAKQNLANVAVTVNGNVKTTYKSKEFLLKIPKPDIESLSKEFGVTASNIILKGKEVFDWCESKGKVYKNYRALLKTCLRRDTKTTIDPLAGDIPIEDLEAQQ